MLIQPPKYTFSIDTTTRYAGNFLREMCAFVTGVYGECEVGKEIAESARAELEDARVWGESNSYLFPDIIDPQPDEHGCFRPCNIGPTPGFWNDGYGKEYPDSEWEHRNGYIQEAARDRRRKDAEGYRDGPNHRLYEEGVMKAGKIQITKKYPACQSVEIYFYKLPPPKMCEVMQERALRFDTTVVFPEHKEKHWPDIEVIGFRLIERRVAEEVLRTWSPPEGASGQTPA